MNAAEDKPPRRRERPYLNWLEQSRDSWKARATASCAEANALRRKTRRLAEGRDRWKAEALSLRRELRRARRDAADAPKK